MPLLYKRNHLSDLTYNFTYSRNGEALIVLPLGSLYMMLIGSGYWDYVDHAIDSGSWGLKQLTLVKKSFTSLKNNKQDQRLFVVIFIVLYLKNYLRSQYEAS